MRMNSKGNTWIMYLFAIVLVVVAGSVLWMALKTPSPSNVQLNAGGVNVNPTGGSQTGGTTIVTGTCGTATLKLSANDFVNRGTNYTNVGFTLFKKLANGTAYVKVSDYNAFSSTSTNPTLNVGDSAVAYFDTGNTANTYNGGIYNSNATYPDGAPCGGDMTDTFFIEKRGDVAFTVVNANNLTANAVGSAQAIGANDSKAFGVQLDENVADALLGSVNYSTADLMFLVDGNASEFLSTSFKPTIAVGDKLTKPNGWNVPSGDANYTDTWAYDLGLKGLNPRQTVNFKLPADSKTSVDPQGNYFQMCVLAPRLASKTSTGLFDWYYRNVNNDAVLNSPTCQKVYYS